ncbi:MAG: tetratricopeptide repeat protein [Acidobacteriota bacterium]
MRSRSALPDPRPVPLLLPVLALVLAASVACSGAARGPGAEEQLEFGVQMAREGLWQEALFRFERANRIRPGDPKILNNMAVALEANGRFQEALEAYREALRVSPGNQELKENYARFVDFFESYRSETGTGLLEQVTDEAEEEPGR